jgi:hypothetical protein
MGAKSRAVRYAERSVLAQAVGMIHAHEQRLRDAALGRGRDDSAAQWEEWDELRRRVSVLDQAEAEEEARNG